MGQGQCPKLLYLWNLVEQNPYSNVSCETPALHRGMARLCTRGRSQPQADARHRLDESRSFTVLAELSTQPMDGHPRDIPGWTVVVAPHVLCERLRRHHRVAVPHEVFEEPEFGPGQTDLGIAIDLQQALAKVQAERTHDEHSSLDRRGLVLLGASGLSTDPRDELAGPEWLHDVVVRAHVERTHLPILVGARGEHHDGQPRVASSELR